MHLPDASHLLMEEQPNLALREVQAFHLGRAGHSRF